MSAYPPPTETLPIFNVNEFIGTTSTSQGGGGGGGHRGEGAEGLPSPISGLYSPSIFDLVAAMDEGSVSRLLYLYSYGLIIDL